MNQWDVAVEAGMIDPAAMVGGPVDLVGLVCLIVVAVLVILLFCMWVLEF